MRSAMRAASLDATPRSTMPYEAAGWSDMLVIHEIVPCHHAAEALAEPLRDARLIERPHADEHGGLRRDGVERKDRQLAEASSWCAVDRARAHSLPGTRGIGAEQARRFPGTETHERALDSCLQLIVELFPPFEVPRCVLDARRRGNGPLLQHVTRSSDGHLKRAQRGRRL